MTTSFGKIPMPGLLSDARGSASDRDPATSHEHAPIEDRPARDPSDYEREDPLVAYARKLWLELDRVAHYLHDGVADAAGGPLLTDARPLLMTEEQWQRWRTVYSEVLSTLAGPGGDGGYGEQEAKLIHQNLG